MSELSDARAATGSPRGSNRRSTRAERLFAPTKAPPRPKLESDQTALLVPTDDILAGRNARSAWDRVDETFKQFAESIREQGILEPLLVREIPPEAGAGHRTFQLLAGYRRYAAARHLNMPRVPVRVLTASDDEALAINLVENLARGELSETDALRAVEELQQTYGWGVRKIARVTGRTPGWISALLTVARSRQERAAVESGQIGMETAVRLARLKEHFPDIRRSLLGRINRGERVLIEDVPRLSHLQAARSAPAERSTFSPAPAPVDEVAAMLLAARSLKPGAVVLGIPLELTQTEQSLVRNLRIVVRQVLSTLHAAWLEQGSDRHLPANVGEDLERVYADIRDFLALRGTTTGT